MMKTPIKTPVAGIVTRVRYSDITKELSVTIEAKGFELKLYHIDNIVVHPGDHVLQGDIIGYSNQEVMRP